MDTTATTPTQTKKNSPGSKLLDAHALLKTLGPVTQVKAIKRLFASIRGADADSMSFPSKDQCWNWQGAMNSNNPTFCLTKNFNAARIVWAFIRGAIPPGWYVVRTCDNPLCVNPAHHKLSRTRGNGKKPSANVERERAEKARTQFLESIQGVK